MGAACRSVEIDGQHQHRGCFMSRGVFIATFYPLLYNCMMHKNQKQYCLLDILLDWHVKKGIEVTFLFFSNECLFVRLGNNLEGLLVRSSKLTTAREEYWTTVSGVFLSSSTCYTICGSSVKFHLVDLGSPFHGNSDGINLSS
jgi:hypothetical protein